MNIILYSETISELVENNTEVQVSQFPQILYLYQIFIYYYK